jgi:hypothetical protein
MQFLHGESVGHATNVTISGSYAYVVSSGSFNYAAGLYVVDISTPSDPQIIGWVDTGGTANGVTVSGSYAYLADGENGLQVIDISTPSNPYVIGSVGLDGYAMSVAVSGSYAYVSADGLQVIDISTPSNPQVIGSVDTGGAANSVAVLGDYAYVAEYYSTNDQTDNLYVIDISTPSNPKILSWVDAPDDFWDFTISGSYLYVVGQGLHVIDISTPPNPESIGLVTTPDTANDVDVSGNYAYVANGEENGTGLFPGLLVIDINTPSNPQAIGSFDTQYGAHGITVSGSYAYVACSDTYPYGNNGSLVVIDVSTPSSPQRIGSVDTYGGAYSVAVSGSYAYVAAYNLQVIDISTPSNPQVVGFANTPRAYGVAVSGNYAYVANSESNGQGLFPGLHVIDISIPSNPEIIGSVDTPWAAKDVAVLGNYAYVLAMENSDIFHVIDISTPSNPQIVGSVDCPGDAWSVTLSGGYAFVAAGQDYHGQFSGIHVIDISTPSSPQIIGTMDTLCDPHGVVVSGSYVYVADDWGLVILPEPVEVETVTVNSGTEISASLPSAIMPGRYSLTVFNDSQNYELFSAVSFTEDSSILNSKVIIVAGGGPDASGGTIWEETKLCANKAYDSLILQGYEHDSIYYMSMETGNAYVDKSNPATFLSDLSDAINLWSADASQLLLYFVDHGIEDQFILYSDGGSSQMLSAQELDGWLDTLQGTMTGPVTFIYDACEAGSFVSKMRPTDGKERIVVTSSSYEPAYFLENGESSFSFQFWDKTLLNKGNLGSSFSDAREAMKSYQSALIEANWDNEGKTNESEDLIIAEDMVIRRGGYVYIGVHPFVTSVSDAQTLSGETSATLWASGVIDAESVWALIIPPDINPDTSGIPITDLPTIELTDPDDRLARRRTRKPVARSRS